MFIKVCALDQSTVKTGYAIFNDSELVDYGLIDLHKNKDKNLRFDEMSCKIGKLIHKEKPDKLVFEHVNLQTSPSTLILLAQLQGIIIAYCQINHICYTLYKPSQWRKILGFNQGRNIKRPELKQQAKDYVKRRFTIEVSEDEADAICIGKAFITNENKGVM